MTQIREKQLVSGLGAQSDERLNFGLGHSQQEVLAEVKWCGMVTEFYPDLKPGTYQKLIMGKGQKAANLK